MSIKVTIDKSCVRSKVVEPFDVYRYEDGTCYVALAYNYGVHLHELSGKGNVWNNSSTFGDSCADFEYVGKLSEVVVTP